MRVFVIGGGASLRGFDWSLLKGRHVVAANEAGREVPWADALVFTDPQWFDHNKPLAYGFRGRVICAAPWGRKVPWLQHLRKWTGAGFPPSDAPLYCRTGKLTGQTAVGVAVWLGARRVVLLGMDGKAQGLATHYHGRYGGPASESDLAKYRDAWTGWHADARRCGVEIVNAGPDSAVTEFPRVDLARELEG